MQERFGFRFHIAVLVSILDFVLSDISKECIQKSTAPDVCYGLEKNISYHPPGLRVIRVQL